MQRHNFTDRGREQDELLDITLEKDMDLREYAKQIITEKILAQEELEKKCSNKQHLLAFC